MRRGNVGGPGNSISSPVAIHRAPPGRRPGVGPSAGADHPSSWASGLRLRARGGRRAGEYATKQRNTVPFSPNKSATSQQYFSLRIN
jgi:hypothetical protein